MPTLGAQQAEVARGFAHFYNLEFDEAIEVFRAVVANHPENPHHYNYLSQGILYREMHRAGALESELVTGSNPFLRRKMQPSPEDEREFEAAIAKALELSEAVLKENTDDVEALYASGVAYALRSNYNFLVRKQHISSLRDATRGRKAHNRITELKPDMTDARLMQGVHEYVVGSLPFTMKILSFLAGYRGDREGGIRTIQEVARDGIRNREDAEVVLAAIYRRERRPTDAIPLLHDLIRRFPRNYLFRFELAQMYSDLGDKASALEALRQVAELKRQGVPGYTDLLEERILFSKGVIQFWYNDLESAIENLSKAAAKVDDLDLHAGVNSLFRLGQSYDLIGEREKAIQSYRKAIAHAPESDAAREAKRYLSTPYRRQRSG